MWNLYSIIGQPSLFLSELAGTLHFGVNVEGMFCPDILKLMYEPFTTHQENKDEQTFLCIYHPILEESNVLFCPSSWFLEELDNFVQNQLVFLVDMVM